MEKRKNDEKPKNDDRMAERHAVLDKALDELAKAFHLQIDCAQQALVSDLSPEKVEALEQSVLLTAHCLRQVNMILMPSPVSKFLEQKYRDRVVKMETLIRSMELDDLKPLIWD